MSTKRTDQGRIFWGLILIILGVLFLFDQLGEIDFGEIVSTYWPVVFIVLGLSILAGSGFRSAGPGLFFILFGAFFLLMRLEILHHSLWHYWPVFVIAAGLWILLRPVFEKSGAPEEKKSLDGALAADELGVSAVFQGLKRRIESPAFKGGRAEVVLGSLDLDLTGAGLAGNEAVLYLSIVLGSIVVRVPREWQVVIEGSPVLGDIDDKRRPAAPSERKATLRIKGSAVLGSIDIKD
jgi:predicted membrane protein